MTSTGIYRTCPSFALVLGLLFLAPPSMVAQEETGRWTLGFSTHTGASYRSLVNTDGSEMADVIITLRNDREAIDLALGAGLRATYRLSPRFSVEAGIGYARFGNAMRIDMSDLTFGDMIDPRRGFVYETDAILPASLRFMDRYHYVELPVGIVVELGSGRWRSSSTLGVAPAFLVAARSVAVSTYPDGNKERDVYDRPEKFERFNLIPYLSSGISMHPGGRWQWSLRPTVRYGALQVIDAPISGHWYSMSLDLGIRWSL